MIRFMKWFGVPIMGLVLFAVIHAGAVVITYTYDDAGRLIKADFGERSISYTYDPAGNLTKQVIQGVVQPGDVNGDGAINLADAIAALKTAAGLPDAVIRQADVNNDQKIGLEEAVFVLWKAVLP